MATLPRFEGTPLRFDMGSAGGTLNKHVRWFAKKLDDIFRVYETLWPGFNGGQDWSPYKTTHARIVMTLPKADAWELYSRLSAIRDGLLPMTKQLASLATMEQPKRPERRRVPVHPPRGSVVRLKGFDEVFAAVQKMYPSITEEQLEHAKYRPAAPEYDSDGDSDDGYTLLCAMPAQSYLVPGPEVDPNLATLEFQLHDTDLTNGDDQWDGTGDTLLAALTLFKL